VLASQLSTLANCSLVLLLQRNFDHKQVEEVCPLVVRLVIGLVVEASFQLGLLSARTILGPKIGKTVQLGWTILDRDLRDEQPLW